MLLVFLFFLQVCNLVLMYLAVKSLGGIGKTLKKYVKYAKSGGAFELYRDSDGVVMNENIDI
jgi:hypothetical protein